MKDHIYANVRQSRSDTAGERDLIKAVIQDAIRIARGGPVSDRHIGFSDRVTHQTIELQWIYSDSNEPQSLRWYAGLLGLHPDEVQSEAIRKVCQ